MGKHGGSTQDVSRDINMKSLPGPMQYIPDLYTYGECVCVQYTFIIETLEPPCSQPWPESFGNDGNMVCTSLRVNECEVVKTVRQDSG